MQEDASRRSRNEHSASEPASRRLAGPTSQRSLFEALAAMRDAARAAQASAPLHERPKANYMQRCAEKIFDASSVVEAIFWHCEMVNELAVEMHTVAATPWPDAIKRKHITSLEERATLHGAAINRLSGIVQRNEQVVWTGG